MKNRTLVTSSFFIPAFLKNKLIQVLLRCVSVLRPGSSCKHPSEEHKHKWDPALSQSYQFTVARCSRLPLSWLASCCKALLKGGDVMGVKDFCSCFCLADQLKLWHFSCPDSFCFVWEAKQVDLVPSQGIQRLIVLVSGRPSKEDVWTLGKDFIFCTCNTFECWTIRLQVKQDL